MADRQLAKEKLVKVVIPLIETKRSVLEGIKAAAKSLIERPDFIWYAFLSSMATWGASRWHNLMANEELYNRVSYDAMANVPDDQREQVLLEAFSKAGLRYSADKAKYMAENYIRIREMGGAETVKDRYLALPDRHMKMMFLDSFAGIGDKYARNIPMDIYDEDFHNAIAVDDRLKDIAVALGFSQAELQNYAEMEMFFLSVAKDSGLNGWEIDRLLYNFEEEILAALADT